jgi:hypothetical protein
MIDMHILIHPTHDRSVHLKRVLRKLGKIPHLVNVIQLDGTYMHIGMGRMQGFSSGNSDYVTFMDDDDDISTDVFQSCIDILDNDSSIDAVVTDERHVINGKIKTPLRKWLPMDGEQYSIQTARYIHHLVVLRRTSIQPYIDMLQNWPDLCEFNLYGNMILDGKKFIHLDKVGYYWYQHDNNARSLRIPPSQDTINLLKQMYTITNQ